MEGRGGEMWRVVMVGMVKGGVGKGVKGWKGLWRGVDGVEGCERGMRSRGMG